MYTSIFKKKGFYLVAAAMSLMTACNNSGEGENGMGDSTGTEAGTDTSATSSTPMVDHAEAMISGTNSDTTVDGSAKFDADNGKVKLTVELNIPKLANKSVAVHIHEDADCGDAGKMAHGHWNPTNQQHGKWGEGSFHLGDIGNVKLDGDGKGTVTVDTDLWTLGGPTESNVIGHSIIVHSGEDDYTSQPSGNAGSRIGCGVIK